MIHDREAFSYRSDPDVPEFRAGDIFTVMDAQCALCARGAAWIGRHDHAREFTIIPVQSQVGAALMVHYGLDPGDPASWLYVEEGRAYSSLDAFIRTAVRLGGVWKAVGVLRVLPRRVQDALYQAVARNRYRVFGKANLCSLPNPDVQKRLLR